MASRMDQEACLSQRSDILQVFAHGPLSCGLVRCLRAFARRLLEEPPHSTADQGNRQHQGAGHRRGKCRPPTDPPRQTLPGMLRSRQDRLTAQEALQILRQRSGAGVA